MSAPFSPFAALDSELCAPPSVKMYVKDTWAFPYTFLQPLFDANGNPVLDANGQPVPNPEAPVVLTGSAMSAELYVDYTGTPLAVLATSTDADTNLALGKFKFLVPSTTTAAIRPDLPQAIVHPVRLAIIQTDALGDVSTLAVQHIAVATR